MENKIRYELEFPINSSPQLLYQYISTPSGLQEWFADNAVNDTHNAGALLTFLCGENNINEETLYYGCESDIGLDYKAYKKECIKMGWYKPKNICLD